MSVFAEKTQVFHKFTVDKKASCNCIQFRRLKVVCGTEMPCSKHNCQRTCFPKHAHDKCTVIVPDVFPGCGHAVQRKCFQDIVDLECKVPTKIRMPRCGHIMEKVCSQSDYDVRMPYFFNAAWVS
jgi:hypothetical protein